MSREKVLERVRKLKRLAEDQGIGQHEQATYIEKMALLMAEHLIAESELAEDDRSADVEIHMVIEEIMDWKLVLIQAITEKMGVVVVAYSKRPELMTLIGKPLAVRESEEMITRIFVDIYKLCMKAIPGRLTSMERMAKGMGIGIAIRIINLQKEGGLLPVVQETSRIREKLLADPTMTNKKLGDKENPMDVEIDSVESFTGAMMADQIEINKSMKD
jgi:hypothetical protein